jgi:alpha-amylase
VWQHGLDLTTQNPNYIGNFIENHDLPRWRNQTVDPQLGWNAMVAQYVFNGIPTVYYGQEQDFQMGAGDPYNRAALWPSEYANTTTYNRITRLNTIRHALITNSTAFNGTNFHDATAQIVGSSATDVAIRRGPVLAILTNVRISSPRRLSLCPGC